MEEQLYRQKYERAGERVVMYSIRCGAWSSQYVEQLGDSAWWRREEGTREEMKQENLQKLNIKAPFGITSKQVYETLQTSPSITHF